MRELPEPDGYYFREDSLYIGGGEDIKTGDYRPETVLAIQKQAYEDGLRDAGITFPQINAAAKVLAERMDYPWSQMPQQGRDNMREIAQSVIEAAMLTASQKEPQ